MATIDEIKVGKIGLAQQQEDGRIVQIGLTSEQSSLLQNFLAILSKESKLVLLPQEYDFVLRSTLCKKCKEQK